MKLNTIKKRQDFVDMSRVGNRVITKGAVVESHNLNSDEEPKLGFTASKKVGKSVYRSKAKRRLKESVRHIYTNNPKLFKSGHHYNFIARYTTIGRDFQSLIKDIKYALHNIDK